MTVVVKLGGGADIDADGLVTDVATLLERGESVVVVHGGSSTVDSILEDLGIEPEYVETPGGVVGRFTDAATMQVFKMALPGVVNTDLVTALQAEDVPAIGLSGVDGGLLSGPRKSAVRVEENGKQKIRRGDHAGRIDAVNESLLTLVVDAGYVPVVSPPILASDGVAVNCDADRVAARIAGVLEASLVLLSDVPGVLADQTDPSTLIEDVDSPAAFADLELVADGFMTRKVMAGREALEAGAATVVIGDAATPTPIVDALQGAGTHIQPEAVDG